MKIFNLSGKTIVIVGGKGKLGNRWNKIFLDSKANTLRLDIKDGVDATDEKQVQYQMKRFKFIDRQVDILIYAVMAKPLVKSQEDLTTQSNQRFAMQDYYADCEDYPMETFRKVIDANLNGAYLCAREAKKYGCTNMIFVSSVQGLVGADPKLYSQCNTDTNPYGGQHSLKCPVSYTASKWGLIGLAKHLACWWAPAVRVNVLAPSGIYDGQEEGFVEEFKRRCPMRRMANWDDYDGAIVFLASDASKYMTGSVLTIDGGWTAW